MEEYFESVREVNERLIMGCEKDGFSLLILVQMESQDMRDEQMGLRRELCQSVLSPISTQIKRDIRW